MTPIFVTERGNNWHATFNRTLPPMQDGTRQFWEILNYALAALAKAHLRRQDSDDIFSAPLPVSDMPTSIDQWLDKSLLAMNDIDQMKSDTITFKRTGSGDDHPQRNSVEDGLKPLTYFYD